MEIIRPNVASHFTALQNNVFSCLINTNLIIAVVVLGLACTGWAFLASAIPGPISQVEYSLVASMVLSNHNGKYWRYKQPDQTMKQIRILKLY